MRVERRVRLLLTHWFRVRPPGAPPAPPARTCHLAASGVALIRWQAGRSACWGHARRSGPRLAVSLTRAPPRRNRWKGTPRPAPGSGDPRPHRLTADVPGRRPGDRPQAPGDSSRISRGGRNRSRGQAFRRAADEVPWPGAKGARGGGRGRGKRRRPAAPEPMAGPEPDHDARRGPHALIGLFCARQLAAEPRSDEVERIQKSDQPGIIMHF